MFNGDDFVVLTVGLELMQAPELDTPYEYALYCKYLQNFGEPFGYNFHHINRHLVAFKRAF